MSVVRKSLAQLPNRPDLLPLGARFRNRFLPPHALIRTVQLALASELRVEAEGSF